MWRFATVFRQQLGVSPHRYICRLRPSAFPATRSTRSTTGRSCPPARPRRGRGPSWPRPTASRSWCAAASELVSQLHTITSRRIPPTESAVLSVTRINGGQSHKVLPSTVELTGTVRSFDAGVQDTIEAAIRQIAHGTAQATGTEIEVEYVRYYPATVNTPQQAALALRAAQAAGLHASMSPAGAFTSEDFAFMLQARRGAYLWLGQGLRQRGESPAPPLHHPRYDFNDEVLPLGVAWLVAVAQLALGS